MTHVVRCFLGPVAIASLTLPAIAAPLAGPGLHAAVPRHALALPPVTVRCDDREPQREPRDDGDGDGDGETPSDGEFFDASVTNDGSARIYLACEDPGQHRDPANYDRVADVIVTRAELVIDHCEAYSDVWRVDCLSNELERMAQALANDPGSRKAKAEIRKAAAELRALAEQNADPTQPAVRRAVERDGVTRKTTRPITPVAPDRVAATNLAADRIISELSTTLLRSSTSSSASNMTRAAAAIDSTKVLLRSA